MRRVGCLRAGTEPLRKPPRAFHWSAGLQSRAAPLAAAAAAGAIAPLTTESPCSAISRSFSALPRAQSQRGSSGIALWAAGGISLLWCCCCGLSRRHQKRCTAPFGSSPAWAVPECHVCASLHPQNLSRHTVQIREEKLGWSQPHLHLRQRLAVAAEGGDCSGAGGLCPGPARGGKRIDHLHLHHERPSICPSCSQDHCWDVWSNAGFQQCDRVTYPTCSRSGGLPSRRRRARTGRPRCPSGAEQRVCSAWRTAARTCSRACRARRGSSARAASPPCRHRRPTRTGVATC